MKLGMGERGLDGCNHDDFLRLTRLFILLSSAVPVLTFASPSRVLAFVVVEKETVRCFFGKDVEDESVEACAIIALRFFDSSAVSILSFFWVEGSGGGKDFSLTQ